MDAPTIFEPYEAAPDITVLPSYFPIPGMGILPVNAFVLRAAEPLLVDSGLVPLSDEFMEKLAMVIDPADLKWLWLTHTDQDHIGSLWSVLERAPDLRIITTFLGMGKMSLYNPLPPERVYLVNPGQSISIGDRKLTAVRPPTYDAPETTGFYDTKTSAFFSADSFGALLSEPVENAADIKTGDLKAGFTTWAGVDAPWSHMVNEDLFKRTLDGIRKVGPRYILSNHLPVAHDITEQLLGFLAEVPPGKPFVGPDQQALEEMLKQQG